MKAEFGAVGARKRTFAELRRAIIKELSSGQQTTNQLSIKSCINWRTVEAHLTFLVDNGLVREVLKSEYVRIFALTPEGEQYARLLQQPHTAETAEAKVELHEVVLP